VYDSFSNDGDLEAGIFVLGVENGAVGYSLDEFNAELVSDEMKAAVDAASAEMVAGTLVVHDYMSDETCPALEF
jgi:basic membrane protein A